MGPNNFAFKQLGVVMGTTQIIIIGLGAVVIVALWFVNSQQKKKSK